MTRPVLHRGGYPPIDLHAIAKAMNDARAIGNPSPFTVAEGKRVYRELERFNAEHPLARFDGPPRHIRIGDGELRRDALALLFGVNAALWLIIILLAVRLWPEIVAFVGSEF